MQFLIAMSAVWHVSQNVDHAVKIVENRHS